MFNFSSVIAVLLHDEHNITSIPDDSVWNNAASLSNEKLIPIAVCFISLDKSKFLLLFSK